MRLPLPGTVDVGGGRKILLSSLSTEKTPPRQDKFNNLRDDKKNRCVKGEENITSRT